MADDEDVLNPYLAPKAWLRDEPKPRGGVGIGYFLILLLNGPALFLGYAAFMAIGDSYAPMIAMFVGLPAVIGQGLIGVLPAGLYYNRYLGRISTASLCILFGSSILATILLATGMILAFVMPRTHGCGC
jgi:hypothetical protein